jgi:hypothetical protein
MEVRRRALAVWAVVLAVCVASVTAVVEEAALGSVVTLDDGTDPVGVATVPDAEMPDPGAWLGTSGSFALEPVNEAPKLSSLLQLDEGRQRSGEPPTWHSPRHCLSPMPSIVKLVARLVTGEVLRLCSCPIGGTMTLAEAARTLKAVADAADPNVRVPRKMLDALIGTKRSPQPRVLGTVPCIAKR